MLTPGVQKEGGKWKGAEGVETAFSKNSHEGEKLERAITLRESILFSGVHLEMYSINWRDAVDDSKESEEAAIFRLRIRNQKKHILRGWGEGGEETINAEKDNTKYMVHSYITGGIIIVKHL